MIYVLLTDGFEETEAIEPIDIMRRAGLMVTTAGVGSQLVKGAHNITVKADILIDDINKTDMELLMLPGGPGHTSLDNNEKVQELIDYAYENDLYIAAICASPSIIGKKGLLKGKKATCFPGYEKYLTGAEYVPDKAVADGKIITGKGAGAAADFGFLIVETLRKKSDAKELRRMMQY
ncbi:MAG: DJ-1 family glyoxalase III [Clostridia bacterium]|nr:DJ-1 family glyoxalase III [Clostridia bacterium]